MWSQSRSQEIRVKKNIKCNKNAKKGWATEEIQ